MATFKFTSVAPVQAAAPAFVPNTTLEQDRETVLRLWAGFGNDKERLKNWGEDDVSKWYRI